LDGALTDTGGNVTFRAKGDYVVTVTMTDDLGRAFAENKSVTIYPIPAMQIALPATNYSGESIPVTVTGSELDGLGLVWSVSVNGGAEVPYSDLAKAVPSAPTAASCASIRIRRSPSADRFRDGCKRSQLLLHFPCRSGKACRGVLLHGSDLRAFRYKHYRVDADGIRAGR
jgi:hypothetical protein